ncbi:response regulator [Candidatus Dojkabacteria bacterium]|uniref:Response regulator n=1 Tax=Candidatus Dojkabacteria bacterium TaxID=2099670 RepID=A0A955L1B8_9BACT|nr:response regulator [Candidatus Dojkabacteria bacterium]
MAEKLLVILFNDSDPVLSRVAKMKFKNEAGIDLIITGDYDTVIQAFNLSTPKLLISEILLNDDKDRTGFDLIRAVRVDNKDTIIVILTELGQEEDKQKALNLGANYYYVKTEISVTEFIKKIKELL